MAARDGDHRQHDRYRYQYYQDPRVSGKRHQLKVEYDSDNECPRVHSGRQRPSPPRIRSRSVVGIISKEPDMRHSRKAQIPSPPPLNRNKSTKRDPRPKRAQIIQPQPRIERDKRTKTSLYLTPDRAQMPYRYEPSRQEIPSPTFFYPPIPKIIVSGEPKSHNSESRHSDRPWVRSLDAGAHIATVHPPTLSSSSSSGVLGEKTYQYKELRPYEFRLVRVFAKKMSLVQCEIIHSLLRDTPSYTAISYAWGDADDKRTVQINTENIPVAVSLHGALDAVRKRAEDVLVWVDALCINQQNRDERSRQVQLMPEIYARATEVAIWLGPSENDSHLAINFLMEMVNAEADPKAITALLSSPTRLRAIEAVVHLFQRDYWKRLWVVQEVFNAKTLQVYCGDSAGLSFNVYKRAAHIFQRHKKDLDISYSISSLPRSKRYSALQSSLSYSQALVYEGPNNLLHFDSLNGLGEESLLNIMRAFRRKLTSDPRDRVFGILGVLPEAARKVFPVNYNSSVKEVYTNVVDYLLYTTERLDVICESIHFPKQTSVYNLPSWVPDWSHAPETTALGYSYDFSAASDMYAEYKFLGERRNELEISAVYIDTIRSHGVAVGTLCTLADYLMAFLHWRAILMESMGSEELDVQDDMEEAFCRTLCLGQIPLKKMDKANERTPSPSSHLTHHLAYTPSEWIKICYYVFATQIRKRLPRLPMDDDLRKYADMDINVEPNPRQFLQSNFGSRMMGRSFFLTQNNRLGMGTGFMLPDDIIIVPLGCRTPIVIRKEGNMDKKFRFVGDLYVDGYMHGKAMKRVRTGEREIEKFVLV
ncbi:heterokaryon incompatibility protein-domain-containing protein [Xylariaceae sp. FL1651]|nr:heterokaryon incompatibility protein-domain-containing protein [Xylariaceae sp. FL1651]